MTLDPAILEQLAEVAARHPHLHLLALHGSRARGQAHPRSDWDFAFLADPALDREALHADLVATLHSDAVDLADLRRASAVLRFHVASEGLLIHQEAVDVWLDFRLKAADFWCEAGPVIRNAQEALLAALGPAPEVP
jgi:predicted nucleotidyltransferase